MDDRFTGLKSVLTGYYDFYMLEAMAAVDVETKTAPQKKWKKDLTAWNNEVVSNLALAIRDYLYIVCCGEARHAWVMCNLGIKELRKSGSAPGRLQAYNIALGYGPTKLNIARISELFTAGWRGSGYGGKKWLQIIEAVSHYKEWPDSVFIDHAADLQHNGGGVFSKIEAGKALDFRLNINRTTLQKWFYTKAVRDILKEGNPGSTITAAAKTKNILNAFFVTRDIKKPDWVADIDTLESKQLNYKPVKWGDKKWSKPENTGMNWKTTEAAWECICEKCANASVPVMEDSVTCDNCSYSVDECECCSECNMSTDECSMCGICGSHDCEYCFFCGQNGCEHEYECCSTCEKTYDLCECCKTCYKVVEKCPQCPMCSENECQHKDEVLCCTNCGIEGEINECSCDKEPVDDKDQETETTEKEISTDNAAGTDNKDAKPRSVQK